MKLFFESTDAQDLGNSRNILQVEFYDRKGSLLKTLKFDDYQLYLDKYWRAHTMAMTNHQTGKSTLLTTSDLQFQTGLRARDFEKNILKRVK